MKITNLVYETPKLYEIRLSLELGIAATSVIVDEGTGGIKEQDWGPETNFDTDVELEF